MSRPSKYIDNARGLVRHYTAGLNVRDLRRMFGEDASKAYRVLSRDQEEPAEGPDHAAGFFQRVRIVLIGISEKLSPARRLIFAIAVIATLLGLLGGKGVTLGPSSFSISVGTASFYLIAAIAGFAFLFTMELVDRVRVRDELEVARQLQADLLPHDAPEVPGYAFAHSYRTANEVGGDYYDISVLPDGRVVLVIGDASGHGIAAGLLMAIANATLKTAVEVDPAPEKVARLLNSTLYRTGDRRAFMSLFYALLEPESGIFDFVCAGHPFPILRRRDGSVVELGSGTLPLGMRASLELAIHQVRIETGESLLLYTDGLPEALDANEQAFGFARLERLASAGGSASRLHDSVLRDFEAHLGTRDVADDVTLMVVSRLDGPA